MCVLQIGCGCVCIADWVWLCVYYNTNCLYSNIKLLYINHQNLIQPWQFILDQCISSLCHNHHPVCHQVHFRCTFSWTWYPHVQQCQQLTPPPNPLPKCLFQECFKLKVRTAVTVTAADTICLIYTHTISLIHTLLFHIKTTWYLQPPSLHQVLHTPSRIRHFEQQKYIKHFPNCSCCCLHVPCHMTGDTDMKSLLPAFPSKHNIQFFTSIPRPYII